MCVVYPQSYVRHILKRYECPGYSAYRQHTCFLSANIKQRMYYYTQADTHVYIKQLSENAVYVSGEGKLEISTEKEHLIKSDSFGPGTQKQYQLMLKPLTGISRQSL
jgi:hypothetical protein